MIIPSGSKDTADTLVNPPAMSATSTLPLAAMEAPPPAYEESPTPHTSLQPLSPAYRSSTRISRSTHYTEEDEEDDDTNRSDTSSSDTTVVAPDNHHALKAQIIEELPTPTPSFSQWISRFNSKKASNRTHPSLGRTPKLPLGPLPKFGTVMIRSKSRRLAGQGSFPNVFPCDALAQHDVTHEDWRRFLAELSDAGGLTMAQAIAAGLVIYTLAGYGGICIMAYIQQHRQEKNMSVIEAFVETWNAQFFNPRGVEVSLSSEEKIPVPYYPGDATSLVQELPSPSVDTRSLVMDISPQSSPTTTSTLLCPAHSDITMCQPKCSEIHYRDTDTSSQSSRSPTASITTCQAHSNPAMCQPKCSEGRRYSTQLSSGRPDITTSEKSKPKKSGRKGRYVLTVKCL